MTAATTERPGLISPGSLLEQISAMRLAHIISAMEEITGNRVSITLLAQFMNVHQAGADFIRTASVENIAAWILEGMRPEADTSPTMPDTLPIPKPGTFLY